MELGMWIRRLVRGGLYILFSVGTVMLAGSLSPERLVRHQAEHPALNVVREMAAELPASHRAEWIRAAENRVPALGLQ